MRLCLFPLLALAAGSALVASACPEPEPPPVVWECQLSDQEDPDFGRQLGCLDDFDKLASQPLEASIPGARSVKTVLDRVDDGALYFQNSERYPIHWNFASEHLSGNGLPIVPDMGGFNTVEYFSPDRRFILGAVTWYQEPDVWVWELSPYDTASAEMIAQAFRAIAANAWFGTELGFHPTSEAIERVAEDLPDDIPIVTTETLFDGITYQPLNLATTMGQLQFRTADELEEAMPWYREIVVLDRVPNDLAVVMGIITAQFQTPLSHINVLSQNRGTPNMGLAGAFDNAELRALEGRWVELTVEALDWSIREVTEEEANAWWEEFRPEPIDVDPMDVTITELTNDEDLVDVEAHDGDLSAAISAAVPSFGGKASHFGAMSEIEDLPHPDAFVVPVYWYDQHMTNNGLWEQAEAMLADSEFQNDAVYRAEQLEALQEAIKAAPIDPNFLDLVVDKLNTEFTGRRMRFRSSTNAEDVSGFNGAGLYTSKSGDPNDPERPVDEAIKKVWSSVWRLRAYEERQYYGIEHRNIGMALLVHRSFPDEDANGVAVTGNIFDTTGLSPAFYVNVQAGDESVVLPDPDVTTDQFLYYYTQNGQPTVYLGHSNLIDDDETVMSAVQVHDLGEALTAIHQFFFSAYGGQGWYAMDIEFKIDATETGSPELVIKQARPYPGRGQ